MNLPAVVHRPTPEYIYPRARDKLTIQITTAREDFKQVTLVYWPRYETSADKQIHIPMKRSLRDANHDYYRITIQTDDVAAYVRYCFALEGDGETVWLGANGFSDKEPAINENFFEFLWPNETDGYETPDWFKQQVYYIGIDLGGTNIKGALVNEQGIIEKQRTCPTHAEQGVEAVTETIAKMIRDLAKGKTVSGVGLGCPGMVDDKNGKVVYACNLGWVDYDVRTALKELTGYDVRLVNDANAAALAEAVVGAAKGAESAVVVTLGTGVGGGVVIGGKLLTGYTGAASELGHMVIVADGEGCACGRKGCFEAYSSATALIRMTTATMEKHPESAMHQIAATNGGVDGKTAFAAQQAGDIAGEEVVREYVHYLSIGIANIVNIFFPEVIALSGGVANQGENLLVPLREKVGQQEYGAAYTAKHPRIVCCTLGNTAGMIGAALFAKE